MICIEYFSAWHDPPNSRGKGHVLKEGPIKQRIGNVWESFGNCLGAFGNAWERMGTVSKSSGTAWGTARLLRALHPFAADSARFAATKAHENTKAAAEPRSKCGSNPCLFRVPSAAWDVPTRLPSPVAGEGQGVRARSAVRGHFPVNHFSVFPSWLVCFAQWIFFCAAAPPFSAENGMCLSNKLDRNWIESG